MRSAILGALSIWISAGRTVRPVLNILKVGFANGFPNDLDNFAHADVPLSLQLACLLLVKIECKQGIRGCFADVPRGDHGELQIGMKGPTAMPIFWMMSI